MLQLLLENKKINKQVIQEYIDKFYSYVQIYTDASKDSDNKVGVAFTVPEFRVKIGKRVNNEVSVYTGELLAILLAVQWVEDNRPLKSVICSDSSSALKSVQYNRSDSRPDILIEVQQTLYRIQMMGLMGVFMGSSTHWDERK